MQIRKGPFGYFAYEKIDNPDTLSTYAEEVIAGNKSDFFLNPSTEYIGSSVMCCFEFSGYVQITDAEFSVFPSQKHLSSHKKENRILSLRRKTVGDLFYSFIQLLDNLVSPSTIELEPDMVFTDPEGISIKLCCLPVKSNPDEITLASLGASRLEKFLSCDYFKGIISDDEKNALVFSVKENNEKMFVNLVKTIQGIDSPAVAISNRVTDNNENKDHALKFISNLSKTEKELLLASVSSLLSLIFLFADLTLSSILSFLLTLFILFSIFKNKKKAEEKIQKEKTLEQSKQRSSILFSDTAVPEDEKLADISNTKTNTYKPLVSGKLTLLTDVKDIQHCYSVYLDETFIGSDCFLSDIVIDDPKVSPLHAVIKKNNGLFYLIPKTDKGKTYIEDSPVEKEKNYEIKSGQKITIGEIEFRFTIENGIV